MAKDVSKLKIVNDNTEYLFKDLLARNNISSLLGSGILTSLTLNTFFAAPSNKDGVPLFRKITASDLPILNQDTTGIASYAKYLRGRQSDGTYYGSDAGNNIIAEWNTMSDNRWYLKAASTYECRVDYATTSNKVKGTLKFGTKSFNGSSDVVLLGSDLNSVDLTSELNITGLKTFSGETYLDSFTANSGIIKGPLRVINKITGELIGNASTASNVAWSGVTNRPTNLSDFTDDLGNSPIHTHSLYLTSHQSLESRLYTSLVSVSLNENTDWAKTTAKTIRRGFIYNTNSTEWSYLFGLSTSGEDPIYGAILRMGYSDTYLRILRVYSGNWKSTDWEKISAGYADSAGVATNIAWSGITNKPNFVNSFGAKTGDITIRGGQTGNGSINLVMSNNELLASIVGLGSNAYTSTAYLPLAGGTMTGPIKFSYNNNGNCNVDRTSGFSMFYGNQSNATDYGFPFQYSSVISFMTAYCGILFANYGGTGDNRLLFRNINDRNVWTPWYTIYHTGNLSPMTTSHPANGITADNIKNWNSVYNWYSVAADNDGVNDAINTWKEVEAFLTGVTDLQTLTGLLSTRVAKSGDNMTGVLTMNAGTGFQMKYTSGENDPWMYVNGYPNYGIRYFEGSPDKMTLSASGNNNSISGADLCINGNGEGTVTIRGNTILHAGNYNSYSPKLDGTGASGTWGINISGNATTATTATNVNGGYCSLANESSNWNFSVGSNKITPIYCTGTAATGSLGVYYSGLSVVTNYTGFLLVTFGGGSQDLKFRKLQDNGTWHDWHELIHSDNIGSYNAGSATRLQTPRTIWGQSFDGTGDVNGTLHLKASGNNYTQGIRIYQNGTGYAGLLLGGNDLTSTTNTSTNSWFISTNINGYFSVSKGGYLPTDSISIGYNGNWLINGGNVGVGTTSPSYKLHVNGDSAASSLTSTAGDVYVGGTSGSRCHIKMDTTNKCIKFIFD